MSAPVWITVLALVLGACAVAPDGRSPEDFETNSVAPTVSPNDPWQYRYLTLSNGITALLVSAPGSPKGAAAMNVNVGSGENPPGRGGLAHFLEHMLFLGTDKYPDAGAYGRYISEHGGSQNAYTNFEHTNYFFDIEAQHLPGALDRFAQFFIAPRFDAEYVDREKNAVEAEYRQSLKSDARRQLDVLQEVMNPEHPYSQISVGTLETLADRPQSMIRDELIAFYERYYQPERMALVVLGPQELDELEDLTRDTFGPVAGATPATTRPGHSVAATNSGKPPTTDAIPAAMFDNLPLLLQIEPNATRRQLQVFFPIADYRPDYDVKPAAYVANLVGHEGAGSLLSQLKTEGLVEGLSASTGLAWRGGALFSVTASLTEKGVSDYRRVLELLFNYVDMLRKEGAQEWLYEENAQLAELQFRFLQHGEPMGYVTMLASALHYYAPPDVLRGPYVLDRFDREMIDGLVAQLRPDNALVILTHENVQTDRRSGYYQVPYSLEALESDWSAMYPAPADTAGHSGERAANTSASMLSLPEPNPFIPEDVSLVALSPDYTVKPTRLVELPGHTVWFGQEAEFRIPKGGIYVNFRSPLVAESVEDTTEALMYVRLLNDELNELTYPAFLAGLNFSFYTSPWGISMRVTGYTDQQDVLMEQLIGTLRNPALDEQRFRDIRDRSVRALQNRVASRPSSQAMSRLNEALLHKQWSDEQQIAALQAMDVADVRSFVERFWADVHPESLVYGNYRPETAEEVSDVIARLLPGGDASRAGLEKQGATDVASAITTNPVVKIIPSDNLLPVTIPHDDCVVTWYLQAESPGWIDRAATALTAQVMNSEFFRQLRTEQQLGYTVSVFPFEKFEIPGLVMLIQSPVADAAHVAGAMEAFLDDLESGIDPTTFERHRQALLNEVLEPDKNLWERAEFFWQSMAEGRYEFDSRQQLADAVEALDYTGWLEYFGRVFMQQRHSLRLVAPGQWAELPTADHVFESTAEFKQSLPFYEFR